MTVWSSENIEQLRQLAASGASCARIAARLNRTQTAVRKMATHLGIALKSPKEVREDNGLHRHWAENRGD